MIKSRYRRIVWFFALVLVNITWWDILLPRIGLRKLSQKGRTKRLRRAAASFRVLAIQMGGVMIKIGQFLSARLDVLPREVTDELAGLQDEVQPEVFDNVRAVIESEFDAPLDEKFTEFERAPIASASIGQVHCARIRKASDQDSEAGESPAVVVKVQRPNIEEIIEVDLSALRVVGDWLQRYPPIRKRANVPALLSEFSRSLYEEVDYLAEGKNAETFAENFKTRSEIIVPHIIWSHTTRRVLTLEDVGAIKITDYAAIEAAGINRAEVANRLFDTYLKQIFEDRFFHADPHPGNLFVLPLPADGAIDHKTPWKLVFIDFGMVGRISPHLLSGLREILIAAGLRDGGRLVRAYKSLDVLLPGVDLDLLEKASNRVFERFWGKTAPELRNMRHEEAMEFAHEFGDLIYEMPFQIPENLILLGRSMGILSGMCTGLNPDFNIWTNLAPYAQKLMEDESGGAARVVLREITGTLTSLVSLPRKAETLLNRIEQGRLEVKVPEISYHLARLERMFRRLGESILLAAFLVSSVQAYLAGHNYLAGGLGVISFLLVIWLLTRR
ncbi:MAG: AarF/ABC1/UbiB kinase family protein [Anaerolineaceae bacterium]|nr:AarF/ABC1/UbiB kinase family protein [Anaerolineaceae bacterium]